MASFVWPPLAGSGSGTVTSVSVTTANGFAGTVATGTTTPAITLSTTVTGILQGNGTAISAATTGNLTSTPTTNLVVTGGTGAVLGTGVLLTLTGASLIESTSSVLTITGATNAVLGTGVSIQVKQATTSVSGYLSSTDWTTFNGKQAAGNYITALTGDLTASGPGSVASTLATVNANVGSFAISTVTVNAKGLVTAASAATTTGTGSVVLATSPTLITPILGAAAGTSLSLSGLTASQAVFTDGSKNLISNAITGTGNVVMSTSPTIASPTITGTSSGANETLSGTLAVTGATTLTGGIVGSNGTSGATAGNVGQVITASASAVTAPATNVWGDLTSISLTPGDWSVNAQIMYASNGAVDTTCSIGVSVTSGNSTTGLVLGQNRLDFPPPPTGFNSAMAMSAYNVLVTTTTTYYLKMRVSFTGTADSVYGLISARRMR